MQKWHVIRRGLILAITLVALTANAWSGAAQECSDLLNVEFQEAEANNDYAPFIDKYNPCELAFVAVQRLAAPYLVREDWAGAVAVFQQYEDHFPAMKDRFEAIVAMLQAPQEGLVIENLGPGVNTAEGEFHPVISADGGSLYFSRNCGSCDGGEDIFVSHWYGKSWSWAREVKPPISTRAHEMVTGLSSDGNTLLLFGNYPGSLGRGDIFYSERSAQLFECWTPVQAYPPPVNSEYFDSDATMAADGTGVLFISERPGGVGEFHRKDEFSQGSYSGNTDIYVYVETAAGPEVINLGETINTPYGEYSPFLHPDGKTLYFSSEGHYGLGGLDVFKATRLQDDSWTAWSEPVNLGKEINSPYNDWGYQISTDGTRAYFAAAGRPGGLGGNDIYAISMPSAAKPQPVVTVAGTVSDPAGQPLAADIRWNDLEQQQQVGENRSDPQTGKYFIPLPAGRRYSYQAEKEGYIGKSEPFDLRGMQDHSQYQLDIVLYPVEQLAKGEVAIRLNNIFFDFDKYELRPESKMELDRWVKFLKDNTTLVAEIQGHTDNVGSDTYNQTLSEERARAVQNYLVAEGISVARIPVKGFGESQPVDTNDTPEGRQDNRRVEIKFIDNLSQ
jgi:outer membrane protein OmpA-like peptidoglycan-associated protein